MSDEDFASVLSANAAKRAALAKAQRLRRQDPVVRARENEAKRRRREDPEVRYAEAEAQRRRRRDTRGTVVRADESAAVRKARNEGATAATRTFREVANNCSRARATSVTWPSLSPGKSNTLTQSIVPMRFQASQANVKVKLKTVGVQTRHTRRRRRTGRLGKKT